MTSTDLPELTFEQARAIGTFEPFDFCVTPADIDAYSAVTGDASPLYATTVPPGFAGIFGRQSYLREHQMPPGGILLRQDIAWHEPASIGTPLEIKAEVVDAVDNGEKKTITFRTTARQEGRVVCVVDLMARWPK
jgi:acyl dehydratase